MSTDNREDYLINILRLTADKPVVKTTELAAFMDVSPASVTEMLKVLQKEGLVNYEKYKGVSLTESGERAARDLRRKHHIMERFLTDVLELDHKEAHDQACAVEHSISDDAANKMCRIAGTKVDKDCETCTNPCSESGRLVGICTPLSQLRQGEGGEISHLSSEDAMMIRKLVSMGLVPGRPVEVSSIVSEKGARIIKIGSTSFALDYEMCSAIHINL